MQVTSEESRPGPVDSMVELRLTFQPPYDAQQVGHFLRARTIAGLETHDDAAGGWIHRRVIQLPSGPTTVEVSVGDDHVLVRTDRDLLDTSQLEAIVRQWLDLDAEPQLINETLSRDEVLRPLVRSRPGMRVPTTVDAWETLVRAIVGQQVSVAGATTVLGRLVSAARTSPEPTLEPFPDALAVADLGVDRIAQLGMPGARARSLALVAQTVATGEVDLRNPDHAALRVQLLAMPGIGPWTVNYMQLRGLGDRDAFPETDLIVKNNARRLGLPEKTSDLALYSQKWSPWRAYAAHHIWSLPKE